MQLVDEWRDAEAWDQFVESHSESRYCHLFRYGDVVACYGYKPRHLAYLHDDNIVAVLPAAEVKSFLFPRRLVSQPFSEYGGLLIDPTAGEDAARQAIELTADYLARRSNIQSIEMHGNHGIPADMRSNMTAAANPHQIGFLPLDRSVDELWNKVVRYSVRKAVNQAERNGIRVFPECSEQIIRDRFFPLYLRSMKRLGAPPHDIRYYLDSFKAFGSKMLLFWAYKDETPLAGLLGFACGKRINIINIVSDPQYWNLRPNDMLHWEFIKWAAAHGFGIFDFGSIRYDGQMTFKKKWGCEMMPHETWFLLPQGRPASARTVNSSSELMTMMAKLWTAYMPMTVGRLIGPTIRRHLIR